MHCAFHYSRAEGKGKEGLKRKEWKEMRNWSDYRELEKGDGKGGQMMKGWMEMGKEKGVGCEGRGGQGTRGKEGRAGKRVGKTKRGKWEILKKREEASI